MSVFVGLFYSSVTLVRTWDLTAQVTALVLERLLHHLGYLLEQRRKVLVVVHPVFRSLLTLY
jgi:sensor c-di-GMP phosphodiesterase-like protein